MNVCKTCGTALYQDGTCPSCIKRLKRSRRNKKLLLVILALVFIAAVFYGGFFLGRMTVSKEPAQISSSNLPEFHADDYDIVGTCGADLKWGYVEATGELTIIGTGKMDDYSDRSVYLYTTTDRYSTAPWGEWDVKIVRIHGAQTIGDYAFFHCDQLNVVTLPDSVTSIGMHTFERCSNLRAIDIPEHVDTIKAYAFRNCSQLNNIVIPNGVKTIDVFTFDGCSALTTVTIPNSVTKIGAAAFTDCPLLSNVYYGGSEESWSTIDINHYSGELTNARIFYNS